MPSTDLLNGWIYPATSFHSWWGQQDKQAMTLPLCVAFVLPNHRGALHSRWPWKTSIKTPVSTELLHDIEQVKCPTSGLFRCGSSLPSSQDRSVVAGNKRVLVGVSAAWIRDPFPPSVVQAGRMSPRLAGAKGWEHPHWSLHLWAHSEWGRSPPCRAWHRLVLVELIKEVTAGQFWKITLKIFCWYSYPVGQIELITTIQGSKLFKISCTKKRVKVMKPQERGKSWLWWQDWIYSLVSFPQVVPNRHLLPIIHNAACNRGRQHSGIWPWGTLPWLAPLTYT